MTHVPKQTVAPTASAESLATTDDPLSMLMLEWNRRRREGAAPTPEELCPNDPELREQLRLRILQTQIEEHTGPSVSSVTADSSGTSGGAVDPDMVPAGYSVVGVLGRGGMGIVYQAVQQRLNRPVALKMVLGQEGNQRQLIRFLVEAEAMATVRHPNVAQVYECGEDRGRPFLALEYLEGGTLGERLQKSGPIAARDAVELLLKIAHGVEAAHRQGVVHRDLKPANVLFSGAGEPKVTDFGLAKHGTGQDLTATSTTMGTPACMSPEQARGETKYAGPPADVYALGVILYECLTGTRPFEADRPILVLEKVINEAPKAPSTRLASVPRDLDVICLKCLRKEPDKRYASAGELAEDLRRYLEGEPILARPAGRIERSWKWMKRNPTRTALAALGCMILVGIVVAGVLHQRRLDETRSRVLVDRLRTASLEEVFHLQSELDGLRPHTEPLVRELLAAARSDPDKYPQAELNAAVTLLQWDQAELDFVLARAVAAEPEDIIVLRRFGGKWKNEVRERLEPIISDPVSSPSRRLRAQTILAEDEQAPVLPTDEIIGQMLVEDRLQLAAWIRALVPIRAFLIEALVLRYVQGTDDEAGLGSALILREFLKGNTSRIPNLLDKAGPRQAWLLAAALRDSPEDADKVLALWNRPEAERLPPVTAKMDFLNPADERDDEDARRQTKFGIALMAAGRGDAIWPALAASDNPRLRTSLIHAFARVALPPQMLLAALKPHYLPSVRQAIYLAWGEYSPDLWGKSDFESVVTQVVHDYEHHPDPGVHSATEWLLQQWKCSDRLNGVNRPTDKSRGDRQWFVNGRGMNFAVIPGPRELVVGSYNWGPGTYSDPVYGPEQSHPCWVDRTFAIATKEVTLDLQGAFYRDCEKYLRAGVTTTGWANRTNDSPAGGMNWYDAVIFCRWLSEKENVPEDQMCYPPFDQIKPGMKLPADYLRRTGYRLPTEIEWELACRAGARTAFTFGSDLQMLSRYAWFDRNAEMRTHPVGLLKPNVFGLFDVHGNVFEWCGVRAQSHPDLDSLRPVRFDAPDTNECTTEDFCVLRGGDFPVGPGRQRSAHRTVVKRGSDWPASGLRVARTISTPPISVKRIEHDGNRIKYQIVGNPGRFTITNVPFGVTVDSLSGSIPATVEVTVPIGETRPYSLTVQRVDSSDHFQVNDLFIPTEWNMRWYSWTPNPKRPTLPPTELEWARAIQQKPLLEENADQIRYQLKVKHPSAAIPPSYYGLVATTVVDLPAGDYQFDAVAYACGFRVFLDDEWLLEQEWSRNVNHRSAVRHLSAGKHRIRAEYFMSYGGLTFEFQIRPVINPIATKPANSSSDIVWSETTFEVAGTGAFDIREIAGDIAVSPMKGQAPATLKVTGRNLHREPFGFSVEQADADAAGAKQQVRVWGTLAPGQLRIQPMRVNSLGMKFSLIPSGEFVRGSPQEVIDRYLKKYKEPEGYAQNLLHSEGPQHPVQITKPFGIGVHEVTVRDFRRFVEDVKFVTQAEREGGDSHILVDGTWRVLQKGYSWRDPHNTRSENHPVGQITWYDARAFCDWLGKKEKATYRLPTEAEWEYACRAGTTTTWFFGNDVDPIGDYCWYQTNSDLRTQPVGLKKPNPWGLHDIYGNVNEWCLDQHSRDYYGRKEAKDPQGPADINGWRVMRGGDVWYSREECRSASRAQGDGIRSGNLLGFRVAGDAWIPKFTVRQGAMRHLPAREYRVGESADVVVTAGNVTATVLPDGAMSVVRVIAKGEAGGNYTLLLGEKGRTEKRPISDSLLATDWNVQFHALPKQEKSVAPSAEEWQAMLAKPPLLRCRMPKLDYNWRLDAPGPGVPANHFAMMAETEVTISAETAGEYTFEWTADNGARLFLDDVPILESWHVDGPRYSQAKASLTSGKHRLRVEYFERDGLAEIRLKMTRH